jgi:glutamine amidotransferase-like uncharacterized protein
MAFGGFEYQSEAGTRAAALQVVREALATGGGAVPERLRVYYNGGGVFVDADSFKDRGVEVVARYTDEEWERIKKAKGHDGSRLRRELKFKWIFANKKNVRVVKNLIERIEKSEIKTTDKFSDISASIHILTFQKIHFKSFW